MRTFYPMTDTVKLIAKRLRPKKHNIGLAAALGMPATTARSYTNGYRRMPEYRLRQLGAYLLQEAAAFTELARQCDFHARQEARRIKPRTGFWLQRDWYGTGVISDKRWHWPPRPQRVADQSTR